jgi:hypothetical protein
MVENAFEATKFIGIQGQLPAALSEDRITKFMENNLLALFVLISFTCK